MPKIEFANVSFTYRDATQAYQALENVNLTIYDGEFVCLVGHSGCGKSTMLRLLAGLSMPSEGSIAIDNAPVTGPGPDRTIVFQSYSLFPWQSALKNVEFAIHSTNKSATKTQARETAKELPAQVGITDAANRYPFQLSGGMQQRVAIAKALGVNAPVMLLDESFGALDPMIRRKLQTLLLELWRNEEPKKTVLFVTHDIDEALLLAGRVVFMEPKHVVKSFELAPTRSRDPELLQFDKEIMEIKHEVLELFRATATSDRDSE